MRVAIQGELGSFSHQAALRMTSHQAEQSSIVPCLVSKQVFAALEDGRVDAAVIPIENSLAGPVAEHYDLLLDADVTIEREFLLRIRHSLIVLPGTKIEAVTAAMSHPVALAQCRRFFDHHPQIQATPFYDTAGSVKQMMQAGDARSASIASSQAAEHYGGEILMAGIEDSHANFTRFFLIRRREVATQDSRADKVSIAFAVENRPGTLVEALQIFAGHGGNLTKIESRPVQSRPWQYIFYVDYQVPEPTAADQILASLERSSSMVKELGRYLAVGVEEG